MVHLYHIYIKLVDVNNNEKFLLVHTGLNLRIQQEQGETFPPSADEYENNPLVHIHHSAQ